MNHMGRIQESIMSLWIGYLIDNSVRKGHCFGITELCRDMPNSDPRDIFESRHEKINVLHMRKQRRRSASR